MSARLIESLGATEPLAEIFSDLSVLQAMLDFEVALARAEAQLRIIPQSAARAIARAARAETFDGAALARETLRAGTPGIPLVNALRKKVQQEDALAANYVHWGATSQDVADTALILLLKKSAAIFDAELARIDKALRAKFRDDQLKRAVVQYLVGGMKPGAHDDVIADGAAEFERRDAATRELAKRYTIRGRVAVVDTAGAGGPFDKTDLLLAGQERAQVAIVRDSGMLTIAAPFESGWDFVAMFELGGGMPTRVTIPEQRLDTVIQKINDAPAPIPRG